MCALLKIITVLEITLLLFGSGFTKSSDILQCFNDYDTELKCSFNLTEGSCSENNLNSLRSNHYDFSFFACRFEETLSGLCECRIHVEGFVIYEIFSMNVSKGGKTWLRKIITTEDSIKPRRPIITSVIQTTNGDFLISLNTTYTSKSKLAFSNSLVVELTYGIEGSNDLVTLHLQNGQTTYELVGRNLQPNSVYVVRARVKSNYPPNKTFSDFSKAHTFRTPISLQNILKILIPVLCLILIICISSVYFWFSRILKPWWDKIPTPKYSTNIVKQVPQLLSFPTEFSTINSGDSSSIHVTEKTWVKSTQDLDEDEHYSPGLVKSGNFMPILVSTSDYESVNGYNSEDVRFENDQADNNHHSNEFSSGISNRTYSQSNSSGSTFYKCPGSGPSTGQDLLVCRTYSVWNGPTDSGNSKLAHITNNEVEVVLGYQSMDDPDALSSHNDPILEKPLSIWKPQDVPFRVCDSTAIPMEEGYQSFQSVT